LGGAAFLDSTVTQQAAMMAYIDDFWLMLFLTLAVTPLLFLIRPPGRQAAAAVDTHAVVE
jgi:DHA2 family multidrug resistance protein